MTVIVCHGQIFTAHSCSICGAKDSNSVTLAAHEQWHGMMREYLAGKMRKVHTGSRTKLINRRDCPDCAEPARAHSRGYCPKHYMRRKVKGEL